MLLTALIVSIAAAAVFVSWATGYYQGVQRGYRDGHQDGSLQQIMSQRIDLDARDDR